jgi:hypothetical protein
MEKVEVARIGRARAPNPIPGPLLIARIDQMTEMFLKYTKALTVCHLRRTHILLDTFYAGSKNVVLLCKSSCDRNNQK